MNKFMKDLKVSCNDVNNISTTENGAKGYKTTSNPLVDFNFKVASYRNMQEEEILKDWERVMDDTNIPMDIKLKYIFYLRDARGGLGERRLFRIVLKNTCDNYPVAMRGLVNYIPYYGRWDDILCLLSTFNQDIIQEVHKMIINQWNEDNRNMRKGEPVSLMAKWLPSANSHNKETSAMGLRVASILGLTPKWYRKGLTQLRSYLKVVETNMSARNWERIDYDQVPSLAAIRYRQAFLRNDSERYTSYLKKLQAGQTKINAAVTSPVDIVHAYKNSKKFGYTSYDPVLEEAWKNIPTDAVANTIVVRDGSGSMEWNAIGNTNVKPIDVSTALAIFFAEHSKGFFKNRFLTFGSQVKYIDLSDCTSLRDKIDRTMLEDDCGSTNLEAVFDLILKTAVDNRYAQEEIPNVLVISDMEFDDVHCFKNISETLFDSIKKKYSAYGYKLPKLIFDNVCSRTNTIPVTENENGVILLSGFNQNILKMINTGKLDAYSALVDILNGARYEILSEELDRTLTPPMANWKPQKR